MKAGNLDRRITIRRKGDPVDDGYTDQPGALADYAERWASWMPANGREVFQQQGRSAEAGGTFWVRYDSETSGILATDKVLWDSRLWDIVSINLLGRKEGIELIVASNDETSNDEG